MRERGFDAVLVFGTFQGWQNVFYLSNHWDLVSSYLLFPLESEPVLLTGVFPHLPAVKNISVIADVRFGGSNSIQMISDLLVERGLSGRSIGLIEPNSYRVPGIPHGDMARLRDRNQVTAFVPATTMLEDLRRKKSAEEVDVLRLCAALSDECLMRVIEAVRPGVTERDLAHIIASAPGETVAVLVGSTSMTKPDVPAASIRPTSRALRDGDIVLVELSKGGAGYAGQVHGMISVGGATDRYVALTELADETYRSIVRVLRPGATPQQVAEAASKVALAGYTIANPLIHGFGMGIEPGLHVGLPGTSPYWPPADFAFSEGNSLTVEPNPCNREFTLGATSGGLVLVTSGDCLELQSLAGKGVFERRAAAVGGRG